MKQSEHYFQFPIELIRDMLNNPKSVFDSILYYQCSFYDWDVLKTGYNEGINWGNMFMVDDWCKTFQKHESEGRYCGVFMSISKTMFWTIKKKLPNGQLQHKKDKDQINELLELLFYLACKSICGKKRITLTNSKMVWARMFGYKNFAMVGSIPKGYQSYFQTEKKSTRKRMRKTEELRMRVQTSFRDFATYSERGLRGFAVLFSNTGTEEEKIIEMKKYCHSKKPRTAVGRERELLKRIRNDPNI